MSFTCIPRSVAVAGTAPRTAVPTAWRSVSTPSGISRNRTATLPIDGPALRALERTLRAPEDDALVAAPGATTEGRRPAVGAEEVRRAAAGEGEAARRALQVRDSERHPTSSLSVGGARRPGGPI